MIKGMSVVLINKTQTGTDPFKEPIYSTTETTVENVLVSPEVEDDVVRTEGIDGKREAYLLGIPKGDAHTWENQDVRFFGKTFHIYAPVKMGIEANIPTPWHHIYKCERYE